MYNRQPRNWRHYTRAPNPGPIIEPEGYIEERDASRRKHNYSVEVDENLLLVDGIAIPLPHVRGVSSIIQDCTAGRGSRVDLHFFGITIAGVTERTRVYQGDPPFWHCVPYGDPNKQGIRDVLTAREMEWHVNQLAIQRHNVLVAINEYINRVRGFDPANRQLKLGF